MIKHYLIIYILLAPAEVIIPQVNYQVYAESGYFNSRETDNTNYSKLLTRINGEVSYQYSDDARTAAASLNLRPEMYGTVHPQNILKAKVNGTFFQQEEQFGWGVDITRQRNIYSFENDSYKYDLFIIRGESDWNIFHDFPFSFNAGYAFQEADQKIYQYYDIMFLDIKAYTNIFTDIKAGWGIYAERFTAKNRVNYYPFLKVEDKNTGTRWGPQFSLNYIYDFIFNFDYNFLFHNSGINRYPSYEQLIRLLAGTVFLEDFSAFILVDYYKRDLTFNSSYNQELSPVYVPMNLENRVYLKIGYDVSDVTEFYIKTGYLKENLYNDRYSFSGWHILAGIQVSN